MIFEDEFIDIQADSVSLCLELTGKNVDKIYIFIYQDSTMQTFNAFFKKDGTIKKTTDFGSDELIDQFLDIGITNINKLLEICNRYKQKCPNEIKMIYDLKTNKFKAKYGYQAYATIEEKNPDEIFINWTKEEDFI